MGIRSFLNKFFRFGLEKVIYPVCNLIYETIQKKYVIISTSIKPLRYNWGDDVSVVLCKLINPHYRFIPRKYTWNIYKKDDVLCIGSIITWMTTPKSIIWGSGIVYPNKTISAIPKKVLAVRGPLTRDYLLSRGIECPEIYGDPALLFPRYYKPQVEKKFKLGIVPHFRDKRNHILDVFRKDRDVLIIDVQNVHPWTRFIDDICSCEFIASSSLHGIIISDAYNVPNVWIELEGGESKRFAFHDYLLSVDKDVNGPFIVTSTTNIDSIVSHCQIIENTINLELLMGVCPFM